MAKVLKDKLHELEIPRAFIERLRNCHQLLKFLSPSRDRGLSQRDTL